MVQSTLATPKKPDMQSATQDQARLIGPAEFRALMVSHRRMERADRREQLLRGLRDLETGEVFLIDERHLLGARC